jgi:hypothetical protein
MPYIKADDNRREALRNGEPALSAGELNYQMFYHIKHNLATIANLYVFVKQFLGEKPNYQRYNDMTGALIRCAKEAERRLHKKSEYLYQLMEYFDNEIAIYEDLKIKENGDVE